MYSSGRAVCDNDGRSNLCVLCVLGVCARKRRHANATHPDDVCNPPPPHTPTLIQSERRASNYRRRCAESDVNNNGTSLVVCACRNAPLACLPSLPRRLVITVSMAIAPTGETARRNTLSPPFRSTQQQQQEQLREDIPRVKCVERNARRIVCRGRTF